MSNIFDNSIWPNVGGTLGQNKVQIPDGVTVQWPEGDALVGNFVFNKGNLVGFVDTKALTVNESKTTTINYDYVNIELPFAENAMTINRGSRSKYLFIKFNGEDVEEGDSVIVTLKYKGCKTVDDVKAVDPNYETTDIVNGVWSEGLGDLEDGNPTSEWYSGMFYYCKNLESFSSDLSNLTNGYSMFESCSNLKSFNANMSSLTNGRFMFKYCDNLESFTSDLSSLTDGGTMFCFCGNLTSFTSDSSGSPVNLSSLTNGGWMFSYCEALASFSSDLSSLTDGSWMFRGCSQLESFSSDLFSLVDGDRMFYECTNLESFTSNLSSLTTGDNMFSGCYLNTASVQNIADTINTYNGAINIDIANSTPNTQEKTAFNTMVSKGWTVYSNGNTYSSTSPAAITTLDENGEETTTPIPFWAKPVQSDEQHAQYVDSEGNFYNILGAQFIFGDDLSTYGMFTCEEDAAAQMRLTKIEKKTIL